MPRVRRDFRIPLADSRIDEKTGYLKTTGRFNREGVQTYYEDGKEIREYRPAEEVAKAVDSFSLQVVTKDHPPEAVTADNRKEYDIGTTGQLEFVNGWTVGDIVIRDPEGIEAARTTHRELSSGYDADIEDRPGVYIDVKGVQGPPGKAYPFDRIQRNIVGNHNAIVPVARAGERARLDSNEEPNMKTYAIDGVELEIPDKAADTIATQEKKIDELEKRLDAFKKKKRADQEEMPAPELISPEEEEELDGEEMEEDMEGYEEDMGKNYEDASALAAARSQSYIDSLPFLPKDTKFDGTKSPDFWKAKALRNLGMKYDSREEISGMFAAVKQLPPKQRQAKQFLDRVRTDRATSQSDRNLDREDDPMLKCLDSAERYADFISNNWKLKEAK